MSKSVKRKNANARRRLNEEEAEKRAVKQRRPQSMRERLADSVEVSKELTLDVAKITVFGTREVTVENYIGVIEYTDSVISLSAKPKTITIRGKALEIKAMSKEIIYAFGNIEKIDYL